MKSALIAKLILNGIMLFSFGVLSVNVIAADSLDEAVKRFGQTPLAMPKAGAVMRWIKTATFTHSRCVALEVQDGREVYLEVKLFKVKDDHKSGLVIPSAAKVFR